MSKSTVFLHVFREVDQWSNINALHYNLPCILVLLITHFFIEKCDKTHSPRAEANENINIQSCDHNSTLPFLLPSGRCSAMHLCWAIDPLHRQKLILASAKAQPIWDLTKIHISEIIGVNSLRFHHNIVHFS